MSRFYKKGKEPKYGIKPIIVEKSGTTYNVRAETYDGVVVSSRKNISKASLNIVKKTIAQEAIETKRPFHITISMLARGAKMDRDWETTTPSYVSARTL